MQVVNDYGKDVFNGDLGLVKAIDAEAGELVADFDGREVAYEFGELDELVLAYATTVHKAQGSEYPAVVMPVTTQHYPMLQRNLLYTGVTRGRQLVVLVAQPKAVAMAVKGRLERRRWSKLHEWLARRALERAPPATPAGMGSVLPLPEVLEPVGGELGVAGGVLDVAVAEPFLDGAGVVPGMGEREAAGMAQHVRVDGEGELGRHADHRQLLPEAGSAHRCPSLGGEQVRGGGCLLALQPAQGAQLGAADRVHAGPPVLEPAHMQMALRQVEHVPAQRAQLGDAQAVADRRSGSWWRRAGRSGLAVTWRRPSAARPRRR